MYELWALYTKVSERSAPINTVRKFKKLKNEVVLYGNLYMLIRRKVKHTMRSTRGIMFIDHSTLRYTSLCVLYVVLMWSALLHCHYPKWIQIQVKYWLLIFVENECDNLKRGGHSFIPFNQVIQILFHASLSCVLPACSTLVVLHSIRQCSWTHERSNAENLHLFKH